jgi:hypothetical protein
VSWGPPLSFKSSQQIKHSLQFSSDEDVGFKLALHGAHINSSLEVEGSVEVVEQSSVSWLEDADFSNDFFDLSGLVSEVRRFACGLG